MVLNVLVDAILVMIGFCIPIFALGRSGSMDPVCGSYGLILLSMPVGLVRDTSPLEGWERLYPSPSLPTIEAVQKSVPKIKDSVPLLDLVYRGTLEVAGLGRFWFEDVQTGRSIELVPGESDPVTQIRFVKVKEGRIAVFERTGWIEPLEVRLDRIQ